MEQSDGQIINQVITIDDIENAVRIIDYASDQGAFKGWDVIVKVLELRNKLNLFVGSALPKDSK
jgi:hypothetical protein